MTRYDGGLLHAIEIYLEGKSNRKFGVLVIDEHSKKAEVTARALEQRRALIFARERGFKIILVELNPAMTWEKRHATNATLTDAVPPGTEVFFKVGFNAFGKVDDTGHARSGNVGRSHLDATLRKAGVNELLVMGQMGNMCVRLTSVGGRERPTGPPIEGAVDFGYQVWICPQIINTDGKDWLDWFDDRGVKCYTAL
ncbi:isochorismatase family protein [Pelagibius sp. Alg239-R121]|uniref:isochorismatase family protein n=1 Tax=Pelagibius sp. Alg239-R121 TaxID=2993448 RepID=UPI0024A6C10E|nr:isochorismatase family protein [Pelagibius sp. Alg239-R121]